MNYPKPAFTIHDELSSLTPEQIIAKMFESTDKDGYLNIPEWPYDDKDYDEPDMYYLCKMNWSQEDLEEVIEDFRKLEERIKAIKDEDPLQSIIRENRDLVPFSDIQPEISDPIVLKEAKRPATYDVAIRSVRLCMLYTMRAPMLIINNEAQLLAQALVISRYAVSMEKFDPTTKAALELMRLLHEQAQDQPVKIWLDDIRPAPEGYYHCRSVIEAKDTILFCELNRLPIAEINCDHDLGDFAKDGGDGICLLDWLAERKRFYKITLHSMNPVGRANMDRLLKRFWDKWDDYNGEMLGTKIPEVLREATVYYEDLLYSEQGKETLRFLKEKGLTDETIRKFHLGYAPKEKDIFYRYMSGKGWPDAELFSSGLCTFYDRVPADRFQDRILFPVMNEEGQTVTFCGRAMGGEGPVYLNATVSFCFDKKSVIYGLYPVNESGKTELILCEGYLDVILLHQEGFTNAVSNPWSSLTKEQAAVIKRYADSVILSYDSDEAGKRGAARAAGLLKEVGLTVKKLDVSPYKDPYELLRKEGKKGYARRLAKSETV